MAANADSLPHKLVPCTTTLNLLVYGGSFNDVNNYVSALRNDGLAVHAEHVNDLDALCRELESGTHHMFLLSCEHAGTELTEALNHIRNWDERSPILLLAEQSASYLPLAANFEVRDVIPPLDMAHFAFAVQREYKSQQLRCELEQMRALLQAAEERCDQLIAGSRDAIAYISDGMHMTVNQRYLSLFGFEDSTDIEGLPVMDLIAADERNGFKKILRQLSEHKKIQARDIACQTTDGEVFQAHIEFSPALLDGEACTQILIRELEPAPAVISAEPQVASNEAAASEAAQTAAPEEATAISADEALASPIVQQLEKALDEDGLQLVYQPIVSLQGDTREHYAALLRLPTEDGQSLLPNDFLGLAASAGLLPRIDRWVIQHSIQELVKQRAEGRKINFFVNLSGQCIDDEDLLLWICDCLRDTDAKGAWLTFQLKAEDLRNNINGAKNLIAGLQKINCKVAISRYQDDPEDDALFEELSVDYVKLGYEYLVGLATSQEKQDVLNKINAQLQEKEYKTIVVGIEDANCLAVLWNVGINFIQGNFLQEPASTISYEEGQ